MSQGQPANSGAPFSKQATNTITPLLTTRQRLGAGAVLRTGIAAPYRAIELIDGEPHLVRDELVAQGAGSAGDPGTGRGSRGRERC